MGTAIENVAALRALAGHELGPTGWRAVTQEMIDSFAQISGDHQWIHVDVERARRESPWGTTIAHGSLTLALIDGFRDELLRPAGSVIGVNSGYDRVRFLHPVPSGARVRARVRLEEATPDGEWLRVLQRFSVEVEGAARPACVADSLIRVRATGD